MSRTIELQTKSDNATVVLVITDNGSKRNVRGTKLEIWRWIYPLEDERDLFVLNGLAGVKKSDLLAELD